jgi:hypothetical protein
LECCGKNWSMDFTKGWIVIEKKHFHLFLIWSFLEIHPNAYFIK